MCKTSLSRLTLFMLGKCCCAWGTLSTLSPTSTLYTLLFTACDIIYSAYSGRNHRTVHISGGKTSKNYHHLREYFATLFQCNIAYDFNNYSHMLRCGGDTEMRCDVALPTNRTRPKTPNLTFSPQVSPPGKW